MNYKSKRIDGWFFNIIMMLVSVIVLLLGMLCVHAFTDGIVASYIDVLPMMVAILIVVKSAHLDKYVGKTNVNIFLFVSLLITLFNLLYSSEFAFGDFLAGRASDISAHEEHTLTHFKMARIAEIFQNGEPLENMDELMLNQYKWLYIYYSFMIIFGGDVVTHICVFNMLHLAIASILMVLIATKMGVEDKTCLSLVLFICLAQPVLACLFAYHRDIVGQTVIALAIYIFLCCYKNGLANLFAFPVYAALLFSYRLQYLAIAGVLYLWSLFKGSKRDLYFFIGFFALITVFVLFLSTVNWTTFFLQELNVKMYLESDSLGFLSNIILGFIGYFPWTFLSRDPNWSYHVFAYLQGPMNMIITYYTAKSLMGRWKLILNNPVLITAVILFLMAFVQAGHTTYLSVPMPFFALFIINCDIKRLLTVFLKICSIYIVLSVIYENLGLTGSGIL